MTFLLDEPVRDLVQDNRSRTGGDIARLGRRYGDWSTSAPYLAGGGLIVGLAADGTDGALRAGAAVFGVFSAAMANEVLNQTLGRRRPREEQGAFQFDPFHGHASLGSGHAAYTFAIAGAIDELTDGWWPAPFYALAVGTGASRMYLDSHWLSDVVVGSVIGLWVGRRATRAATRVIGLERGEPSNLVPPEIEIDLILEPSFLGLSVTH